MLVRAEAQAELAYIEAVAVDEPPEAQTQEDDGPPSTIKVSATTTRTGLGITRGQIEAKRAELRDAGKPAGYDALARALHASPSTIRRRLGTLK